ncbi:MAG TPA: YhjD/YihY/BrkB family envelope integrity protein, partial [Plasticicumulans sp.]|nr:YhjD/YihY/BrkB family envelope integrity protein [Plasticicumulans sp.]
MLLPERWIAACVPRPTDTATHASVRRLGRILIAVFEAVFDGHLLDRAASLAYTTLLSLVPLLAVSFSVLQAFGAKDVLEPLLRDALTPLGGQAA